mgnify:CR=1 FL=1
MYSVVRRPLFTSFSPSDVANLAFWFKADQITGLNDGDTLTTWNDQSGNSRNVTQGTSTKRPTYKTAILNGLPILRFDGADDFLKTSSEVSYTATMSVFSVIKTSTGFASYPLTGIGSVNTFFHEFVSATSWKFSGYNTSNASNGLDANTITSGAWTVLSSMLRSTTCEMYANGATNGSTARTGTNNSGNAHLTVGAYGDGSFGWLNGDLAEVIIYFADIGDTDRQNVQNYLGSKYAITIS